MLDTVVEGFQGNKKMNLHHEFMVSRIVGLDHSSHYHLPTDAHYNALPNRCLCALRWGWSKHGKAIFGGLKIHIFFPRLFRFEPKGFQGLDTINCYPSPPGYQGLLPWSMCITVEYIELYMI